MQGAGGVGGLISMTVCSGANAGTYFPCYDGNGNVVAMVNAATGVISGNWEYDPFGGSSARPARWLSQTPFLFSTKFYDWETGLYYYGHRYYNPSTGRWPFRDPIGEAGFQLSQMRSTKSFNTTPELYSFVHNDAINGTEISWTLHLRYSHNCQTNAGYFLPVCAREKPPRMAGHPTRSRTLVGL